MSTYLVSGIKSNNEKKGKQLCEATSPQAVWNNPLVHGFRKIFTVQRKES